MKASLVFVFLFLHSCIFSQNIDTNQVVKVIDSLAAQAKSLVSSRKAKEALPIAEQAMALAKGNLGDKHEKYALCLHTLGTCHAGMGEYGIAEPNLLEAASIRELLHGKENLDYANSIYNLGTLYIRTAQYDKAERYCMETRNIRKKLLGEEHTDYGNSLNVLGILYRQTGRYESALPCYLESKAIREKQLGKESADYAQSLSNLSNLYSDMGNFELAEELLIESTAIRAKKLGKEHPDYAQSLNNLAILYKAMGNFEAAEPLYIEAVALWEKTLGHDHPDYAAAVNNLALLYKNMGKFTAADSLFTLSRGIREIKLGKEHLEYGQSLNNQAILYEMMGRLEESSELHRQGMEIRQNVLGEHHPTYAASLSNLAMVYTKMGRWDEARSLLKECMAIELNAFGKMNHDYGTSLSNLAQLEWLSGNLGDAQNAFLECNAIRHNSLLEASRHLSERELSSFHESLKKDLDHFFSFVQTVEKADSICGIAYDNALFNKGFLLGSSRRMRKLALQSALTSEQFNDWTAVHRRLAKEHARTLSDRQDTAPLEAQANALEKQLARTVAGFGEAYKQVAWQDVQQELKLGEVAIEFIRYKRYNPEPTDSIMYSALVLRPGEASPTLVPLFEERDIEQLLVASGSQKKISLLHDFQLGNGKRLYDLVWKPLESHLKGTTTIYCSPSGLLHKFNLGAIPVNETESFLERQQLVLLGSTRQLVVPNPALALEEHPTAVVIGGVRYETDATIILSASDDIVATRSQPLPDLLNFETDTTFRGGGNWRYLPNTLNESLDIARILKERDFAVRLDTGYLASEAAFKRLGAEGKSPRIIQVATHGYFFPDHEVSKESEIAFKSSKHPMIRSGLLLAGAQQAWNGGKTPHDQEDGILTAYEISQLNLENTELVVLSACETGLGDIKGNEGVYGLQRAFKIAGAQNLIMSLWNVNDKSSRLFMEEFYKNWLTKGMSIRGAFRATQLAMKKRYPEDAFHWAGFVLVE